MKKIRLKDQLGRVIRVPTGERQAPQPTPASATPSPAAPSSASTLWRLIREVPPHLQRLAGGAGSLVPGPNVTLTGDLEGRLVGAGDVQISASGGGPVSENVQTGTSYTLALADAFRMVAMNSAVANTLTVPPDSSVAFPVGTRIDLSQDGAGQTTIAAGAGVTIRTPETLKIRKRWGKATLIKRAADMWDIEGNLELAP